MIFENCTLIDGVSDAPRGGMHVRIEGRLIREISEQPIAAPAAIRIDLAGKVLMPGLIDAHVHIYAIHLNQEKTRGMPHTLMTAHAIPRITAMLHRGFTTVRDVAGGDFGMKAALAQGVVTGPRLFVSGRALSQTGGHGDYRFQTDGTLPCSCTSALDIMARIADGVDGVRYAARDELRKGADHLKIMVSGGVGTPHDHIDNTQYSEEEITAAVEEAEARGTYVAAHAYTPKSIRRAVKCGVRTIEHGNFVDSETAHDMAQRGAFMVPTLICYRESARNADAYGLNDEVKRKLAEVNVAGSAMLRICREAGVPMGFGTDLMGEMVFAQTHEFTLRAECLPMMEIIQSATSVNARILGQQGKLGCVAVGAYADLLVIDGDPSADIGLLIEGNGAMLAILKDGAFVRNDLPSA